VTFNSLEPKRADLAFGGGERRLPLSRWGLRRIYGACILSDFSNHYVSAQPFVETALDAVG